MSAHLIPPAMLPVPNPTASYWRSELHRLDSFRSTKDLPNKVDVAIIGAGISGVSVAYHLTTTNSPPSILLLEARQTCSGATGRNGGHVKTKTASLLQFADKLGPTAANAIWRFVADHIDALKDVVEKEGLECEFELRRSFDVFTSADDARSMEKRFHEARDRGDAWTKDRAWIGPEFAERVTSVKGAKGAFSVPACSLWPYKFVTGLLERTMERNSGLNLQTETPVLALEDGPDGSTLVHTDRGTVQAGKVVLATNAYTEALLPEYHGIVVPYKGTAAHLALKEGEKPIFPHLNCTYNLDYGSFLGNDTVDYLNPRPDGGIVVGGGKWKYEKRPELWWGVVDDSTLVEPIMESGHFDNYMQRTFYGWEESGARAEKIWTGIQGATPDGAPHVGKVPGKSKQWILAGFNGGGNALTFLSAKAIARMAIHDVSLGETGVGVPHFFEATEKRLGVNPSSTLNIVIDVRR